MAVASGGDVSLLFHMRAESEGSPAVRLLREATTHIANRGLEGLDVRGLAEAAGTSTSQFAKHYADRAHLLAAVFDQGWASLERHVVMRLLKPSRSLEDTIEAILEGALDAIEAEPEEVSASLIIVFSTTGHSVRTQLKEKPAHHRFFRIVDELRAQFTATTQKEEAYEALELLYGAVLRRLVLLTPMCRGAAVPFDRRIFLKVIRQMVGSMVRPRPGQAEQPVLDPHHDA